MFPSSSRSYSASAISISLSIVGSFGSQLTIAGAGIENKAVSAPRLLSAQAEILE